MARSDTNAVATPADSPAEDQRRAPARRPEVERALAPRVLQALNVLFCRVYHRVTVVRPVRLPRAGPAILVCNHTSGLDPLLLQSACPRLVVWMMAKEYYDIGPLGRIFRAVRAIPVERSGRDMAATRAALAALKEGHVLGVFPEGRIEKTRDLLPFQPGVALMAIKTGVPVYPAYLDGTQRHVRPMTRTILQANRATLAFGPPVEFDRSSTARENLEAATEKIKQAVAALRDGGL